MAESTSPLTTNTNTKPNLDDNRPVFFFDIDNCLYPRSYKIHEMMKELIQQYFVNHLELTKEDAAHLRRYYYTHYGLALSGLVRHHSINVLTYNSLVDDALPLTKILQPSPSLIHLLSDLRSSNTTSKLWLFTNAYITHAKRVVKLLGIEDFFDGVTYCDYVQGEKDGRIVCKPQREMFEKAMHDTGLVVGRDEGRCFFVDDSIANCVAARRLGWEGVAHLAEPEAEPIVEDGDDGEKESEERNIEAEEVAAAKQAEIEKEKERLGIRTITDLSELRVVFPELFRTCGPGEEKDRVGHEPLREETPGRQLPKRQETPLPMGT
ncbi:Haloacid dehalogenase-like hydrolase-domain-containing protein [Terfezia claveryi]|nr:Haloacid dehalogenase-like hydrolase-domain-containing protein [Terfezia claveryi]